MKKAKRISNNKEMIFEIISIIIAILTICLSVLADVSVFNISDIIALKVNNTEDLFFTLFTVQASMATLSIAIITMITGIVNDNCFGISIAAYITNIKPKLFKHNILIIFNLIITVINYICVSCTFFNLSIALFVISVFITILLVKGVYFVFIGKNKMREKIHNYLLENYNFLLLDDLSKDLINGADAGNSLILKEDLTALKEIFANETVKNNYKSTEIISKIVEIIAGVFSKIVRRQNSLEINDCLLVICELYEIANNNEVPLHIDLWDIIFRDFFRVLENSTYEQLQDNGVFVRLRRELYKNLIGRETAQVENSNLKYYAAWTYNAIFKDRKKYTQEEVEQISDRLYENVYFSLMGEKYKNTENGINNSLVAELSLLHKTIIESGDASSISRILQNKFFYRNGKIEHDVVLLTTIIYLYYLSSREGWVKEKDLQKYAQTIIDENQQHFKYFYRRIDITTIAKNYYAYIQNLLYNWEYYETGKVKTLIIDKVIEDIFVFASLNKYWDKNQILQVVNIIASDSIFPLYNRYFSSENQNGFVKLYSDFNHIFAPNAKEDKIQLLKEVFDQQYKTELKKIETEHKISEEQLNLYSDKVKAKMSSLISENLSFFNFQNKDLGERQAIKLEKEKLISMNLTYHSFEDEELEIFVAEWLHCVIVSIFLETIGKQVTFEEVKYSNKNKQSHLIKLTTDARINGDVVIGNRDEFWDEEDKNLLNHFTSEMSRIQYPDGYNFYYILDSKFIEFAMENIQVEFEDLEWDYIEKEYCKKENDKLVFRVTNDIHIPLEKSEIEQHIHNTRKSVVVYADINYRLSKDKVGAGIEIVVD